MTASSEHRAIPVSSRASVELNLTPKIDVVFQLLIYFLLGTSFVIGEQSYRLDLPERLGQSAVDPFELDDDPIFIEVRPGLGSSLHVHVPGPWVSPKTIAELRNFLLEKRLDQGGLYEDDHPVRIQPKNGATWGDAVDAFNAAFAAGYQKISFDRGDTP